MKVAKVSDTSMKPADSDGKRERAPAKGVIGSDNPTQLSDSTRGGGNKATLGSGRGTRDQAPASEAKGSDDPSASLDVDAMDTPETSAGRPAEG